MFWKRKCGSTVIPPSWLLVCVFLFLKLGLRVLSLLCVRVHAWHVVVVLHLRGFGDALFATCPLAGGLPRIAPLPGWATTGSLLVF